MIVRSLSAIENSDRTVAGETWKSRRLLLSADGMGFSMHDTIIHAGTRTAMHYRNHLEAVYCIEGSGSILLVDTDETFPISAGTLYALDQNDRHVLIAETDMRMVCVFNPPLAGPESHDESGCYPLIAETP
ncbi:MAG: ectoine synthase [Planctomycetales bacterium]|nr:ectoine synthase [Planctomycetales bacterium]